MTSGSSTPHDITEPGQIIPVSSLPSKTPEQELALKAEDLEANIPAKIGAIPSYAISDRSRIEITVVTSEFQESMAKNHFSSTSVEASVLVA